MDQKTWLWRKKSSEKTIVATDKVGVPLKRIEEEVQMLSTEKEVEPERFLNEKLAAVLFDTHAKDNFVTKYAKKAQEPIAGQESVKAEAMLLKQELDEALKLGVAANERFTHTDAALKDCKQQLSFLQEDQEKRIRDAVLMASREFEKAQKKLEEKLAETGKRLANLTFENTHMSKALIVKEKLIEDLHKSKYQTQAEFNALMARLDSTEKENAFLKYEFHMLEKELQIRNEEVEYNRQSVDASRKQQLESMKKITRLEAECQRLRLVQKRIPGSAALGRMKSEVQILGRNQTEMTRRKLNPTRDLIVRDVKVENSPEILSTKVSLLIDQLRNMEEEKKILKELITKKNTELHSSRMMCARTTSKLSQFEAQLGELSKGQRSMELTRFSPTSNELSLTSGFDNCSDDEVSSSASWANALISELEIFRSEKLKNSPKNKAIEVSDMSLMDDFVEMEKLAIVSVDTAFGSGHQTDSSGKELVPVVQDHSSFDGIRQEIQSRDAATEKSFDWLQVVLKAIQEQKRISKRRLDELLEDIRIALGYVNHSTSGEADTGEIPRQKCDPSSISGYITWKSPNTSPILDSCNEASTIDTSLEKTCNRHTQSNLSKSINKIIELIEGIISTSLFGSRTPDNCPGRDQGSVPYNSASSAEYFVHVFQWRSYELRAVLQRFIHTCNNLLNGKDDLDKFAGELSQALDWIVNNHKQFGWNEMPSESELGVGADSPLLESDMVHISKVHSSGLASVASSNDQNACCRLENILSTLQEENSRLKKDLETMESAKKDIEAKLLSTTNKTEALMKQLQESEERVRSLQTELEALKESKVMIEDQIENQKLVNEDLDTQLTVAKAKLNAAFQKFSSLEVELEDKSNSCEDLEATCLELQLQLESITKMETPNYSINPEERQPQTGWEITAASAKLAECQETILNLGKQLKALASPRTIELYDKVFSTSSATAIASNNKTLSKRSSLRDRMLAEDGVDIQVLNSPKIKDINVVDSQKPSLLRFSDYNTLHVPNLGSRRDVSSPAVQALAIVPSKKQSGVGLLRKLLLRRKKGSSKKSKSSV